MKFTSHLAKCFAKTFGPFPRARVFFFFFVARSPANANTHCKSVFSTRFCLYTLNSNSVPKHTYLQQQNADNCLLLFEWCRFATCTFCETKRRKKCEANNNNSNITFTTLYAAFVMCQRPNCMETGIFLIITLFAFI